MITFKQLCNNISEHVHTKVVSIKGEISGLSSSTEVNKKLIQGMKAKARKQIFDNEENLIQLVRSKAAAQVKYLDELMGDPALYEDRKINELQESLK